jgi:hypothetical protein
VLTVGALGGITAVAQAGPSSDVSALPAPGVAEQPPAPSSTQPIITDSTSAPRAAPAPGAAPRTQARVAAPPAAPAPVVTPTTEAAAPPRDNDDGDDEGGPDRPTKTKDPKPTKTKDPKPTTDPPVTTDPTTPPAQTSAAGTPTEGSSATPST